MLTGLLSLYSPLLPKVLVYMLQSVEYQPKPYIAWLWRTTNFHRVIKRRALDKTKAARMLLLALQLGMALQALMGLSLLVFGTVSHRYGLTMIGGAAFISYPFLWSHAVVLPLVLGRLLIVVPREKRIIAASEQIFAKHTGVKIAVAGSYGKTSMKELLATVLSEGKKLAATPANLNVAISHARFAAKLKGDEEILIIEYGEGRPGDVTRFALNTHPNIGVITGIAPAHLDHYKNLDQAAQDIFSLSRFVELGRLYANGESALARPYITEVCQTYDHTKALDWEIADIHVDFDGTKFTMKRGREVMKLHSALLGRHNVGPLAFVAALSRDLGLTRQQVEQGIGKTEPYEHRMQPRVLGGAWIIDDTYNGNIEGIKAGAALLKELPAKRRIYVTPGLVDQGHETANVHIEMGRLIAAAADEVVLMHNSVTPFIQKGLDDAGFTGKVVVQDDPLKFYTNLDSFVARGDVVMMQNDWTDNYN